MKIILAGVALLLSAVAFAAAPATQPLEAEAHADGGVHMTATLAAFGSFEWKAAPSYTRLIDARRSALIDLRKGRISVDRAEEIQRRADHVRSLLDRSLATCRQNDRTGKCTGDAAAAERLLAQATAALAVIFR